MIVEHFRSLYDYTFWADRKLWDGIMQLSEEQFTREVDFSHGEIRSQVLHLIMVEYWWPAYLQGKRQPDFHADWDRWGLDEPPTREKLRAVWDEVEANVRAYLAALTEAELSRTFEYSPEDGGTAYTHTPAEILTQVAMHSLDHRAQMMAVMHQMGAPTFTQDFITFLREGQA